MRTRLAVGVLISAAAAAFGAAPARAEATYRATVSPSVIEFPRTRALAYRLEVATGDRAERLELELVEPSYRPRGGFEPVGSPLDLGEPRLEGPGRLVVDSIGTLDFAAGCFRGFLRTSFPRYRLELPARSRSIVVVKADVSRDPPWPRTKYGVTFKIDRGRLKVHSSRPRVTGRRGVQIRLWTRPRMRSFFALPNFGEGRPLRRMSALSIRGRTDPPLPRQLISLRVGYDRRGRYQAFPPERSRLLARVRVDGRGRFQYRWRPPLVGRYQLFARYRRQRARMASDISCPLGFDVKR